MEAATNTIIATLKSSSIMAVYIIENIHQLNDMILHITNDHAQNMKVHVCKLIHRDSNCSEFAQYLHDGQHPCTSVFYVAAHLEDGVRIIVNQLMEHFPDEGDHDDEDLIMTCPACGAHFSQQ